MKTQEEATKMATVLNEQADSLPEFNLFGDSNERDIADCLRMARILNYYGSTGDTTKLARHDEVYAWMNGKPSLLDDYGL